MRERPPVCSECHNGVESVARLFARSLAHHVLRAVSIKRKQRKEKKRKREREKEKGRERERKRDRAKAKRKRRKKLTNRIARKEKERVWTYELATRRRRPSNYWVVAKHKKARHYNIYTHIRIHGECLQQQCQNPIFQFHPYSIPPMRTQHRIITAILLLMLPPIISISWINFVRLVSQRRYQLLEVFSQHRHHRSRILLNPCIVFKTMESMMIQKLNWKAKIYGINFINMALKW